MSRKRALSEKEILDILLQPASYSDSEGEDIEIQDTDDEYIPPPYCSSDENSTIEEVQVTEDTPVHDDAAVSEGTFDTEYACVTE